MNYFLAALKKYAEFSGRARRSEYWFFVLFYILIFIGLAIVEGILGLSSKTSGLGLLTGLYSLGMLIPSLAVSVRRLHDTDRTGWWVLIAFVPLIGAIVLLVFYVQDSQAGENRFGPNPKEGAAA